jgi:hypothetical protein
MAAWLNGEHCTLMPYRLLNGHPFPQPEPKEVMRQMRQWVGDVIGLGWDLERWREKYPGGWKEINDGLGVYCPCIALGEHGAPEFHFEEPDYAPLLPSHWWAFVGLIMNPERERLGRCDRCARFYVSLGRYKRKRYCSWDCAHAVAAKRYLGRRYAEYRGERLALARRLLARWRPSDGDWKGWLVRKTQAGTVDLTRNFLTRCVSRQELTAPPPKKGKRHAN